MEQRNKMHPRIATLFIASTLVVAVHSDNVLKCYMCTSLSNEGCGSDLTANSLQPMECTGNKMVEWQKSIQQHHILNSIARLFEVDETIQYSPKGTPQDMACAKMILNVKDQDVTIRTCQTAKTEVIDPCKAMEGKLNKDQLGKMEQCALCLKEACNGTMILSPEIFYILLTFLGTLIHVAFYHCA